jgi:hypothetical protein
MSSRKGKTVNAKICRLYDLCSIPDKTYSHFIYFWWYWGLNSGLLNCYAGTLSLNPLHQFFFVLDIFKVGSHELFAWTGFKP